MRDELTHYLLNNEIDKDEKALKKGVTEFFKDFDTIDYLKYPIQELIFYFTNYDIIQNLNTLNILVDQNKDKKNEYKTYFQYQLLDLKYLEYIQVTRWKVYQELFHKLILNH